MELLGRECRGGDRGSLGLSLEFWRKRLTFGLAGTALLLLLLLPFLLTLQRTIRLPEQSELFFFSLPSHAIAFNLSFSNMGEVPVLQEYETSVF